MPWSVGANVSTGDVLTASRYNQDVIENLNVIGGAWTAYTPTWTNLTVGNGTQASAFIAAGKLYIVRVGLVFGSTTSLSAPPEFTLPNGVSVNSAYSATYTFSIGRIRDDSAGTDYQSPILRSNTTAARLRFLSINTAGTYAITETVSATVPFTWAVNDRLEATFVFEAA